MDTRYDSRFLGCHVLWTHLHYWDCHRHSGHFIQRGDRHSECAESGQESAIHAGPQLVLSWDYNVLSIWGECDILFQAYCARRQSLATVRDASSVHQLHAIRYGSDATLPPPFHPLRAFAKRRQPGSVLTRSQASYSSSARFKRVTTAFSSPNSPGHTWHST